VTSIAYNCGRAASDAVLNTKLIELIVDNDLAPSQVHIALLYISQTSLLTAEQEPTMSKAPDPFYTRKPVPKELVPGTGVAGLSEEQVVQARERKLSQAGPGGSDVRKFSDLFTPKNDPFYSRKPVPSSLLEGSGVPGLSKEEATIVRERKLSTASGGDLRKFSNVITPVKDPYYSRKPVPDALIKDDTPLDPVERYENRERKLSMFQLTTDPFDEIAGRRTSVVADSALGVGRRRSSAVAPDAMHAATAHHHSGFDGNRLAPIESRTDGTPTKTTTATTAAPAAATDSSEGTTVAG
jgi:hypothetical protein